MKQTDYTLPEQLRITESELKRRKALFCLEQEDADLLSAVRPHIEGQIGALIADFYNRQTSVPEIALLIGDAETLQRLKKAQRMYIFDLFSGLYDLNYVNNRLRIGVVHKRIGVGPELYLSAVHLLRNLLEEAINRSDLSEGTRFKTRQSLDKLLMLDTSLVFETYIRGLLSEVEVAKRQSDQYARDLEERTNQLEQLSRTDSLTGLLNVRHLNDIATAMLRAAQRRSETICFVYLDVNDFKPINDTFGHHRGDDVLRTLGALIKSIARAEDSCFRYGGDEFCVILSNCREEQARDRFVARLDDKIKEKWSDVSLSYGIVESTLNEGTDADTLIRQADEKMYAAKRTFKAKVGALSPGAGSRMRIGCDGKRSTSE